MYGRLKTGLKMESDTEGRVQYHAPLHSAPLPFEGIMELKYEYTHSEGDINSLTEDINVSLACVTAEKCWSQQSHSQH